METILKLLRRKGHGGGAQIQRAAQEADPASAEEWRTEARLLLEGTAAACVMRADRERTGRCVAGPHPSCTPCRQS